MTSLVIIILAMFSMASIFYQIKKFKPFLEKYNWLNLLPNYSFFAPKPISFDYRLVYSSESKSEWIEVPMYKPFRFFRFLWNPFKYYNKGFIDSCQFLLQEYHSLEKKSFIQLSMHYLNILTIISKVIEDSSEKKTVRFSIINSKGINCISIDKVVFASFKQII